MRNHGHNALIQTLLNCALECESCASTCLKQEDIEPMARCVALDKDCADICTLAARLLKQNSEIGDQYLVLCEEICRMCAGECGVHQHDHCKLCAKACTTCADACHAHSLLVTQD